MANGIKIHIAQAIEHIPPGVDTESDLANIKDLLGK
jgi:CMP-2-keto-3-deoxyoctulosonic acid synthetase